MDSSLIFYKKNSSAVLCAVFLFTPRTYLANEYYSIEFLDFILT